MESRKLVEGVLQRIAGKRSLLIIVLNLRIVIMLEDFFLIIKSINMPLNGNKLLQQTRSSSQPRFNDHGYSQKMALK